MADMTSAVAKISHRARRNLATVREMCWLSVGSIKVVLTTGPSTGLARSYSLLMSDHRAQKQHLWQCFIFVLLPVEMICHPNDTVSRTSGVFDAVINNLS